MGVHRCVTCYTEVRVVQERGWRCSRHVQTGALERGGDLPISFRFRRRNLFQGQREPLFAAVCEVGEEGAVGARSSSSVSPPLQMLMLPLPRLEAVTSVVLRWRPPLVEAAAEMESSGVTDTSPVGVVGEGGVSS